MTEIESVSTPLADYARYGLRSMPMAIDPPRFIRRTRDWVHGVEVARPGFVVALRQAALAELAAEGVHVRPAIAALAIVGTPEDTAILRTVGARLGGLIERDAHTAVFEIRQQSRAI